MAWGSLGLSWALSPHLLRLALPERRRGGSFVRRSFTETLPRREVWRAGPSGSRRAQLHSARAEHSLSAGLEGWSVNGPKTSKGRLERARYPIHLNAKPGGHRLSILEPRAAKRW
mgnify:CR=1 FL=1